MEAGNTGAVKKRRKKKKAMLPAVSPYQPNLYSVQSKMNSLDLFVQINFRLHIIKQNKNEKRSWTVVA